MKRFRTIQFLSTHLISSLPEDLTLALKLLEPKARIRYLILSMFQIMLALLEVIALSVLAIVTTIALNTYTNISSSQENIFGPLNGLFPNFKTELKVLVLLVGYVSLTLAKTFISALVTLRTLSLLAKQSAKVGFNLTKTLFFCGVSRIRFGKSQENLSGVTGSLDSLIVGYLGTLNQLSGDIATILLVCIALLFFDFLSSLTLIFLFIFLLWVLHRFVNVVAARVGEKTTKSAAQLNRRILDSWLVYREILLARKVETQIGPTLLLRMEIAEGRAKLSFLPSLSKYIFELFIILSVLAISAVQLFINGISEAISSFVLVAAASSRLLPAILRLQGSLLAIKQSSGSAYFARQILFDVDYSPHDLISTDLSKVPKKDFNATVTVNKLFFTYPDTSKPALRDLTYAFSPGSFTAITGPSGSGKSTLIDLILGFLKPSSGSILIGDLDPIKAQELWPGKISYVPQDVQIFEGSIAENITLESGGESDEAMLHNCLKLSGLLEDILALDEGVETIVGERGLKLSGGQKQRLGISRALYSNPELLIFDEATSSLDAKSENQVTNNIYRNLDGRTIVVIAHRLSTVMNADRVLYIKEGKLLASGSFEALKQSVPEFLEQADLSGL